MMSKRILFIDRDGTLIEEAADFQLDKIAKVRLLDGVIPALIELRDHGYRFVMVSNQDGLGTASFPEADFQECQQHVLALFASQGITFDEIFICPHLPTDGCECRKPRAGLLTAYLAANDIDLTASAVIGDRSTDAELASRIGVSSFMIAVNNPDKTWSSIVTELCYSDRRAVIERKTNETNISVSVNLDRETPVSVSTGIGFYDHMLEQIAKHGGFALNVKCEGDLEIDDHHTVEDTALCLGAALRTALGAKLGIARYGFVVPMDESEARVSIDLSGRARYVFEGVFPTERVGEMTTEMVQHFFLSLSDSLGAALHIQVSGGNSHHMVEACFKAVGRALRQAIRRDGNAMPSTKGSLN
jgi:imidazoleglycerol-phosphate dehydratase/histidinol-phosphatase